MVTIYQLHGQLDKRGEEVPQRYSDINLQRPNRKPTSVLAQVDPGGEKKNNQSTDMGRHWKIPSGNYYD